MTAVDQVIVEASKDVEIILASDSLADQQNSEHGSGFAAELIVDAFDMVGTVADAGESVAKLVSGSFDIGEIAAEAGWLALIILPIAGILWGAFKVSRAAQRWLEG